MTTKDLYKFLQATKPKQTAWDQNNNIVIVTSDRKKIVVKIDKKACN